jgi:3(or 17)beta-hydroxysteroid dehydrogenase
MMRYENRVALVSGGLGGFGVAIAQRLASEGARVVIGDVATADANVRDGLFEIGRQPVVMTLDVTDPASWNEITHQTVERFGRLDLLVNNAGVTSPAYTAIDEVSPEEWKRLFSVNVDGVFFGIQAALRAMKRSAEGGAIVNIGSIASYIGIDYNDAYAAGKSAVRGMTRQMALSAAKLGHNVRINVVHPGYVWTPLVARKLVQKHGSEEKAKAFLRGLNPLGRIVEPRDVANAVAFLGSADARMITGAELLVDAGHVLQ